MVEVGFLYLFSTMTFYLLSSSNEWFQSIHLIIDNK